MRKILVVIFLLVTSLTLPKDLLASELQASPTLAQPSIFDYALPCTHPDRYSPMPQYVPVSPDREQTYRVYFSKYRDTTVFLKVIFTNTTNYPINHFILEKHNENITYMKAEQININADTCGYENLIICQDNKEIILPSPQCPLEDFKTSKNFFSIGAEVKMNDNQIIISFANWIKPQNYGSFVLAYEIPDWLSRKPKNTDTTLENEFSFNTLSSNQEITSLVVEVMDDPKITNKIDTGYKNYTGSYDYDFQQDQDTIHSYITGESSYYHLNLLDLYENIGKVGKTEAFQNLKASESKTITRNYTPQITKIYQDMTAYKKQMIPKFLISLLFAWFVTFLISFFIKKRFSPNSQLLTNKRLVILSIIFSIINFLLLLMTRTSPLRLFSEPSGIFYWVEAEGFLVTQDQIIKTTLQSLLLLLGYTLPLIALVVTKGIKTTIKYFILPGLATLLIISFVTQAIGLLLLLMAIS